MRLRIKAGIIFAACLAVAAAVFYFMQREYVLPVLMYHQVAPGSTRADMLKVTPETFERQMRFLRTHGYTVLPLEKVAELFRDRGRIPAKAVVITLDDGYKDNYTYAYPVLKKYRIPATIFIITGEVGRPQNDRLSWEEIREMRDSGVVSFGSHCLGPEPLVNIASEDEVRRQVVVSKQVLEGQLGRPVTTFAYPEGLFNARIKQLVIDAGYAVAAATKTGKDASSWDPFAVKRIRISENARDMGVFWFESSGYYTFFKERKRQCRK